ncbi:MAG: outer membrane protein assembly factor BamD [Solirubrobacterales bacterium]
MRRAAALLLLLPLLACAHGGVDVASLSSNSDEVVWEAAQKAYAKKNWESARQHFKRIVDGFPQSQHGPAARLGLAESHFHEGSAGSYILAISEYRDFLTLYPSHPKSDYAQFQVAEAYFNQKNGPDRDQGPTEKALAEYERLLDIYPQSSYVEKARDRIRECRQSLARAEFNAGYFYQKTRQAWRAAILRYEGINNEYPDFVDFDEVLYRMAECLGASGRKAEALPYLGRLVSEYPTSRFVELARKLTAEFEKLQGPDAPPATTPAPAPVATPEPVPATPEGPPPAPPGGP